MKTHLPSLTRKPEPVADASEYRPLTRANVREKSILPALPPLTAYYRLAWPSQALVKAGKTKVYTFKASHLDPFLAIFQSRLVKPISASSQALNTLVEQAFQPAGSGGFPAASSLTELESSVNPQAGKPALHWALAHPCTKPRFA